MDVELARRNVRFGLWLFCLCLLLFALTFAGAVLYLSQH
jgi:hypothetical protein